MVLKEIQKDLINYLKAKDTLKVSVLRYFVSAVKNRELELKVEGKELSDEDVVRVLRKLVKQRNQAITQAKEVGRDDIVEKETAELEIIKSYFDKYSHIIGE